MKIYYTTNPYGLQEIPQLDYISSRAKEYYHRKDEVDAELDRIRHENWNLILFHKNCALQAMVETRKIGKGLARMQRKNKVLKEKLKAVHDAVVPPKQRPPV